MPANQSPIGGGGKAIKLPAPAVKSPVAPGTPGYGVLATPVVPKGQLNLRAQPTAPIAHQAGPKSTPAKSTTPTARPRSTGPVILKAEHGMPITNADQQRAARSAALEALRIKLNTPSEPVVSDEAAIRSAFMKGLAATAARDAAIGGSTIGKAALDAVHLPTTMGTGAEGIVKAGVNDIAARAGLKGFAAQQAISNHPENSNLAHLGQSFALPYEQAVGMHGGLHALGKEFGAHPLNTALAFTPVLGVPGRVLGAAGRAGILGSRMAAAADTARPLQEVAPGVTREGLTAAHYSPNLLTALIQKGIDRNQTLSNLRNTLKAIPSGSGIRSVIPRRGERRTPLRAVAAHDAINKKVDYIYPVGRARTRAHMDETVHNMVQALGKNPDIHAANVAVHNIIGRVRAGHETEDLTNIRDQVAQALDNHQRAQEILGQVDPKSLPRQDRIRLRNAVMSPAGEHLSANTLTALNDYLDTHPTDHADLHAITNAYSAKADEMSKLLASRDLLGDSQASRRELLGHAYSEMGAEHGTIKLPRAIAHDQAVAEVKAATKELRDAKLAPKLRSRLQAESALRDAHRNLTRAQVQEAKRLGFAQGRYGINDPLRPQPYGVIDRATVRAAHASDHMEAMKQNLQDLIAEKRAAERQRIANAREDLKTARQNRAALHEFRNEKYTGALIRDENGQLRPLTNPEIQAHIDEHGYGQPSFVSARIPRRNETPMEAATQARMDQLTRGTAMGRTFTGAGIRSGAWDTSFHGAMHGLLRNIQRYEHAKTFDEFIRELGVGHNLTREEFNQLRQYYRDNHGLDLTPVYEHPKGLSPDMVQGIRTAQASEHDAAVARALLDSRIVHEPSRMAPEDRITAVPTQAVRRWQDHIKVDDSSNPINGALASLNQHFRNAVLPWSPKWVAGNMTEAGLRLALRGAGPGDRRFYDKISSVMSPEQRRDYEAAVVGGRHYGSTMNAALMREAHNNDEEAAMHALIQNEAGAARRVIHGYRTARNKMFRANRLMEQQAEKTAAGSWMKRDFREFSKAWGKADDAMEAYLKDIQAGRYDSVKSRDAANYVHDVLGKYDQFSPGMKAWIKTASPFAPWYLAAAKFLYHTLPAHHPLVTAALTSIGAANRAYVNKNWASLPGGTLGDLSSSVQTGPDSYLNALRYTPAGAFNSGGLLNYATGPVMPYLSPAILASVGKDVFGQDLRDQNGVTGPDLLSAINGVGSAFVPGLFTEGERILVGQGKSPYNAGAMIPLPWRPQFKGAETAPGQHPSILAGIDRVLNPAHSTNLKPRAGQASGPPSVTTSNLVPKGVVGSPSRGLVLTPKNVVK